MLRYHLYAHADSVDEREYRVSLRSASVAAANRDFAEVPEDLTEASAYYWQWYYKARVAELGVALPPDAKVLDVACGIGRLGEAIMSMGVERVVFCDLSLSQLRTLRERLSSNAHAPELGDVMALPYASDSFDLVIGNSFLHHLPDVPAAMKELYRVCKPGGRVAVLHEPNHHAAFWESFPVSLYKNMYRTSDPTNFTDLWYFDAKKLGAIIRNAGFADVRLMRRGLLSSLLLNAYVLVMRKLKVERGPLIEPAQKLRVVLDGIERRITGGRGLPTAPSLLFVARK